MAQNNISHNPTKLLTIAQHSTTLIQQQESSKKKYLEIKIKHQKSMRSSCSWIQLVVLLS